MCFIDLSNNRECLILPNGRKPVKVNKILPEDKFSKNTLFKAIIIGIQYAISLFIILAVTNINILLIEKFHSHLEGMSQNLVKYSLVKTISKQKTNDLESMMPKALKGHFVISRCFTSIIVFLCFSLP